MHTSPHSDWRKYIKSVMCLYSHQIFRMIDLRIQNRAIYVCIPSSWWLIRAYQLSAICVHINLVSYWSQNTSTVFFFFFFYVSIPCTHSEFCEETNSVVLYAKWLIWAYQLRDEWNPHHFSEWLIWNDNQYYLNRFAPSSYGDWAKHITTLISVCKPSLTMV